jgi:hypothetical protein
MPIPVPPVINERRKEIDDCSRGPVVEVVFQAKYRRVIQPAIPGLTGKHSNTQLNRVDQDYSCPPRINSRQFRRGPQSLRQDATRSDPENNQHVHAPMIGRRLQLVLIDNLLPNYRFN